MSSSLSLITGGVNEMISANHQWGGRTRELTKARVDVRLIYGGGRKALRSTIGGSGQRKITCTNKSQ